MKDFTINLINGLAEMDFPAQDSMWNNVYISLTMKQGSFFAAPEMGSKLYLLHRAKNTIKTAGLVVDYCKAALKWLIDTGRATSVTVITEQLQTRINVEVTVIRANGVPVNFSSFVEVI